MKLSRYNILIISVLVTLIVVIAKIILHNTGNEVLTLGSLHTGVITGTFFVLGFLLSTTIADYKESERVPSEFSSILENMYEDAEATHTVHTKFDLDKFRTILSDIARSFGDGIRNKNHTARFDIHRLNELFIQMEQAGVPPNYVVKLKQQQAQLLKILFRVTYIQRITFIPSASILAKSIIPIVIAFILFTEIEPLTGGIIITAVISFILVYMLRLIQVISTPFLAAGKTQDDVSLFLIDDAAEHLSSHAKKAGRKKKGAA